jgi:hypothetical protein
MPLLSQIAVLAATFVALSAVSRWITRQVQIIGWQLTGREDAALVIYYLLLLPGIALHEVSHALMARLLGLRVGRLSLGPKTKGQYVQMGAVTVSRGGALRDSLVGLAPWLAGTAILLFVSYRVFDVGALGQAWLLDGWRGVLQLLPGFWHVPDFALWAYLIFAVSNAMMPSSADREAWLMVGLYLALALLGVGLLGVLLQPGGPPGGWPALAKAVGAAEGGLRLLLPATDNGQQALAAGVLPALTLAFLFTVGLDGAAAGLLLLVEFVIESFKGKPRATRR